MTICYWRENLKPIINPSNILIERLESVFGVIFTGIFLAKNYDRNAIQGNHCDTPWPSTYPNTFYTGIHQAVYDS